LEYVGGKQFHDVTPDCGRIFIHESHYRDVSLSSLLEC